MLNSCPKLVGTSGRIFLGARASTGGTRGGTTNGSAAAMAQIDDLNSQLLEKNLAIEGLEKERDFYFGKLRDIEVLTSEGESIDGASEFCQKVLGVLYATEVSYRKIPFRAFFLHLFRLFLGWICCSR